MGNGLWMIHILRLNWLIIFLLMFNHRVDTEMNCHITGSLIPPHTGSMRWLSVHDAEYAAEINGSGYAHTCFHDTIRTFIFTHSAYSSFLIISVLFKSSMVTGDQGMIATKWSRMNKNTEYSRMKIAWWNLNGHTSPERGALKTDNSLRLWRILFECKNVGWMLLAEGNEGQVGLYVVFSFNASAVCWCLLGRRCPSSSRNGALAYSETWQPASPVAYWEKCTMM